MFWRLQQIYTVHDFRQLGGVEPFQRRLSSHVCVYFGSPPSETGVGDYVLAPFNKFMLCMILAGCADGTVLPAAL